MRIIPAIDIINGNCVRLSQGDYATEKIYNEDPLEVAKSFEDHGINYLHLVDLDGARSKHIVNYRVLQTLASRTNLKIDFGGGLKSDEDLKIAFESGASQVTGGSVAVKDPDIFYSWLDQYGSEKIILGADAREEKIMVNGWQEGSSEALIPFIEKFSTQGGKYVICTDVTKDGMLQGPAVELYRKIISEQPNISLIASGGIAALEDLYVLQEIGCEGAILGKAIYEGRISLKQIEEFILQS